MSSNMVVSKLILKRRSPDIGWGFITHKMGEIGPHIRQHYSDTGKLLTKGLTMSDDRLILVSASQWINDEERMKYNLDPIVANKHKLLRQFWVKKLIDARWENYEYQDRTLIREWSGVLVENGILKV